MSTRQIAVVTVGRSDFGIYLPVLEAIVAEPALELRLLAAGAHFAAAWGSTVREIEEHGLVYERIDMAPAGDTPLGVADALGAGVLAFARAFGARRPDLLVVLGDRLEMLCPVTASLPYGLPVAHLYGGKVTEGAVDELVRHALTKMSHLHFVSCEAYAERVRQMGEEPWRVHNVGLSGLDRIRRHRPATREALCAGMALDPARPFLLVTFHPVTLEAEQLEAQLAALIGALEAGGHQAVITYPNADAGSTKVIEALEAYAGRHPARTRVLRNAGASAYLDLMAHAAAMVGNSSSGISEAPSFRLPVVNIGSRQDGALRARNVIDVGNGREAIAGAIARALEPAFRAGLEGLRNPYGDGDAAPRIVEVLRDVALDDRLLRKKFVCLPRPGH